MKENRKNTRVKIESMDVRCKMHFDTDVALMNISLSGACIGLNKPLEMGGEYLMHIESGDKTVSIRGTVIWERITGSRRSEKGEIFPRYDVGLSFEDVITEKGKALVEFIESSIMPKPSKVRLKGVRVKVIKPDMNTLVKDHNTYKIMKISEGGLLIETDQRLDLESRYRMEITLPGEKQPVRFLGRVASCLTMAERMPFIFGAGIEFLEMSDRDRERLNKFVVTVRSF
jgi:hypothetical protein